MAHADSIDDGRQAQFEAMMEVLNHMQARYRGVRGELLAKVKAELERLKPSGAKPNTSARSSTPAAVSQAAPTPPAAKVVQPTTHMLPSCRSCGRTMREAGDGSLVCQNGHTRQLAG